MPKKKKISHRKISSQLIFEKFASPALSFVNRGVMSVIGSGSTSGCSVHVGSRETTITPVHEGKALQNIITCLNIGGEDITDNFTEVLSQRLNYDLSRDTSVLRRVKEKLFFIDKNGSDSKNNSEGIPVRAFETDDGLIITVAQECFQCTEILFDPKFPNFSDPIACGDRNSSVNNFCGGLHAHVHNAISSCESGISSELWKNIVLSGNSTLFPGFPERLGHELRLLQQNQQPQVTARENRQHLPWMGASTFAGLSGGKSEFWLTKMEYEEKGDSVLLSKW